MRTIQLSLKEKDCTFGVHDETRRDCDELIGFGLLVRHLTFIISGNTPCSDGARNNLRSRGGEGVVQKERCGGMSGFGWRCICA